jgi:hypothetical protein
MRKPLITIALLAVFLAPSLVMAVSPVPVPIEGKKIGLSTLETLVEDIADTIIYIAGFIVVGFIVYAGLKMVMSRGDEKKFGEGKAMLKNAIIGALVVFGVGLIVNTIANIARNPSNIIQ